MVLPGQRSALFYEKSDQGKNAWRTLELSSEIHKAKNQRAELFEEYNKKAEFQSGISGLQSGDTSI